MSEAEPYSKSAISISERQRNRYWKLYTQRKLAGQVISVTGWSPYSDPVIENMIKEHGGIVGDKDIWQEEQIIVIGRKAYDEDYLKMSIQFGLMRDFPCVYLSQEAFRDFINYDKYPAYYRGDPRIQDHPGLSFLSSLGFKWPSIDAIPGDGGARNSSGWLESHPLRSIYGYTVQTGTLLEYRQNALKRAVRLDGLGLQIVAEHIAFLIRNAKLRHDDLMDNAIGIWESDLTWLYSTYYKNTIHSFIWPTY